MGTSTETGSVPPDLAQRRVRLALRNARRSAGLSQQEAASALKWPLLKILKIEQGFYAVDAGDLERLTNLYKVSRGDSEVLGHLASEARTAYALVAL